METDKIVIGLEEKNVQVQSPKSHPPGYQLGKMRHENAWLSISQQLLRFSETYRRILSSRRPIHAHKLISWFHTSWGTR